jgi:hypothetical protein
MSQRRDHPKKERYMKYLDHDPYTIEDVIRGCLGDLVQSHREGFCTYTLYEVKRSFRDRTDLPVRMLSKD